MRFVTLSALALIGCADAPLAELDGIGEVETTRAAEHLDEAPNVMPVYVSVDGPVAGTVSLDRSPQTLGDAVLSSADPELGPRPVAVVFVVDQNADMADVAHVLNEPAVTGVRALLASQDETWIGLVGHVDRRAHQLYGLEQVRTANHRLLFGAAASLTTCSTLEDMVGWESYDYDHPVLIAPPCWADETGRDPATALAFAHHILERDAPVDAVKAIVWVGGRQPVALVDGERRPDSHIDQMPTWKRTDREVSEDILVAHTEFVVSEILAEGTHVLQVPVGPASNSDWLGEVGVDVADGVDVHDRSMVVHDFVAELRVLAAE